MDKDILNMIKKVFRVNLVCGIILSVIVQILFKNYGIFVMLGMIVAMFNFFINSVVGNLIFKKLKNSSLSLYMINFVFRIIIAVVIGYAVFNYNKYGIVAYLFGYTSHLLGVYTYSVITNK